jgi:hypothetical protein
MFAVKVPICVPIEDKSNWLFVTDITRKDEHGNYPIRLFKTYIQAINFGEMYGKYEVVEYDEVENNVHTH